MTGKGPTLLGSFALGQDGVQFHFRRLSDLTDAELEDALAVDNHQPQPIIWYSSLKFSRNSGNFFTGKKSYSDGYIVQVYDEELNYITPPEPWYSLFIDHGFLDSAVAYVQSTDYSVAEEGGQTLNNRLVFFTLLVDVHQGLIPCPDFSAEEVYDRTQRLLSHIVKKKSISRRFCLRVWSQSDDERDWTGVVITPKPGTQPFPCNVRLQQLYVLPHAQGEMEAWTHSPTHDTIRARVFAPQEKWLHPQFGQYPGNMSKMELLAYAVKMNLLDLGGSFYDAEDHETIAELYEQLELDWDSLREYACSLFEGQLGENVMAGTMEPIFLDAFGYGTQEHEPGWSPREWLGSTWIPSGAPHLAELCNVHELPNGCPLLVGWSGDEFGNTEDQFAMTITYNVALVVCN